MTDSALDHLNRILTCPHDYLDVPPWQVDAGAALVLIRKATECLRWISQPSYVGNFNPEQVIECHQAWAVAALDALGKDTP